MHHKLPNVKILALVGMPGAGKSSAVDHLTQLGYPKVYFGGIVLEAMKEAGLADTPNNERDFRELLRAQEGKDFVVRRAIDQFYKLIDAGQHHIVADGVYTWTEYRILKEEFHNELITVAITAPRALRYERLSKRPIRPLTYEQARERDYSEIENLEKGGPIAIADYTLMNDQDIDQLRTLLDTLLSTSEFDR